MKTVALFSLAFVSAFFLSQAAFAGPKTVPVGRNHYTGIWLEIARTPMFITDGCVAGYTTYRQGSKPDEVDVVDGCREGTPSGKLKTIAGKGTILDADDKRAMLRVRYPFLITFHYWVIYEAPDRSWFISTDQRMGNLWIYTRKVPSARQLAKMVRKAQSLGYDTRKLEFPPQ